MQKGSASFGATGGLGPCTGQIRRPGLYAGRISNASGTELLTLAHGLTIISWYSRQRRSQPCTTTFRWDGKVRWHSQILFITCQEQSLQRQGHWQTARKTKASQSGLQNTPESRCENPVCRTPRSTPNAEGGYAKKIDHGNRFHAWRNRYQVPRGHVPQNSTSPLCLSSLTI